MGPRASRVVEPTPPRGMSFPAHPAAAPAELPNDRPPAFDLVSVINPAPAAEPSSPARSRPPAPEFDFSPRETGQEVACHRCGSSFPVGSRFCSSCGAPVAQGHTAEATPAPALPPAAPALEGFLAGGALVGAPVLGLGARGGEQALKTTCGRCGGANSGDMAYCQFCGARLDVPATKGRNAARAPANAAEARPAWMDPGRGERGIGEASPSVTPASSGRLVVIAQDGTPGREYVLSGEQTDIGREEGNILLPNDPYVSPRHARMIRKNSAFFVRDLGSVNGVYVRLRRPMQLEHADLVLIGLEVLRFEVVSDAEKGLGPAAERGAHVFGSPAAPRFARLCQRTVEGVTRDVFYLTRDETIIGRESGDIVFTSDPFMSRRHVSITRDTRDGRFTLRDLGSSNGTYLAIRGEIELEHADHVRIGQHLFRLDVDPGGQS